MWLARILRNVVSNAEMSLRQSDHRSYANERSHCQDTSQKKKQMRINQGMEYWVESSATQKNQRSHRGAINNLSPFLNGQLEDEPLDLDRLRVKTKLPRVMNVLASGKENEESEVMFDLKIWEVSVPRLNETKSWIEMITSCHWN